MTSKIYIKYCSAQQKQNVIRKISSKTQKVGMENKNLRVQSQSSLNNIYGVLVLGLEPPVITLSDCFIDLHEPWHEKKKMCITMKDE